MLVVRKYARFVFGVSALAAAVAISACAETVAGPSTPNIAAAVAPPPIATGSWKLQSLTRSDSTVVNVKNPDLFTIEFVDGSARLALRADCNRGFGGYTTNGSTMTLGPVAITKAYCASTAPFDDEYVRLLDGENVVTVTATSLQLSSSRGTLKFGK